MVLPSEVRLHSRVGEVLVRLLKLGFARLVKDTNLKGERHGVAEEHPTHAVTTPTRFQPAVDALVTHAFVHVSLGTLLMVETVREDKLVVIITGWEVQSARVPFSQQHQTLDGA